MANPTSHLTSNTSHLTSNTSHLTSNTSHLTSNTSHLDFIENPQLRHRVVTLTLENIGERTPENELYLRLFGVSKANVHDRRVTFQPTAKKKNVFRINTYELKPDPNTGKIPLFIHKVQIVIGRPSVFPFPSEKWECASIKLPEDIREEAQRYADYKKTLAERSPGPAD